jgi:Pentapeptide repeats (9 copies)
MTDEKVLTRGKQRLEVASYAADLSGQDFDAVYLEASQSLSHSFLNGSSLKNSAFVGAPIDQTELAEAQIVDCIFVKTDLTGSSFIGATVEASTFRDCNFADGEWRKSRFKKVIFQNCDFNYTTVNLCVFDECEFSGQGAKHLDNRPVNYNVFTRCKFENLSFEDDVVLANNFGLPSKGQRKALASYGSTISLEEVCIKSSSDEIAASELVIAVQNELQRMNVHRLKTLRLEFIGNIVAGVARMNRISPTSLSYLETLFYDLGKAALSETDALAAMTVVISLRSLLFDFAIEPFVDPEIANCPCQSVEIRYDRSYEEADARELARILGELATGNGSAFVVSKFAHGSTIMELVAVQMVSVSAILTALNFALRQVNTTLVRVREIRANTQKLMNAGKVAPKRPRKKPASRVTALQRSDPPSRQASLLRQTVAGHGYRAVLMDDQAETTVRYTSSK